ncbi:MAG: hypothetical protein ACO20H_06410 [Bacteriovoracaceae bacterium]
MKNWLIRTKDKKILGPVTLEKIKDLIEKKSLIEEDEVCQGNSFWFWIKEKKLVEKYIYGNEEDSQLLPNEEDLEFPDDE